MIDGKDQFAVIAAALSSNPREVATLARQAGFAGLLFDAYSPALNIAELSQTGRREFRHVLSNQDRQLVALRVDLGNKGFGPGADVDRLLSQLEKLMEAAAGLALPLICVELGPLPQPPPTVKPKPKVRQSQAGLILLPTFAAAPTTDVAQPPPTPLDSVFAGQVDSAMAELGAAADRYSMTIAFRSELSSFAALERALIAARCLWFGIDLDPVCMLQDAWDADEIFSRLGQSIRHVRARDALRGTDGRTKPTIVGQGSVPWQQLRSNLTGAGYKGWITLDPMEMTDRPSAAIAGLKFLQKSQQ